MAERLGEALLAIRTDDGTFYADVTKAKGASEQLGTAMDKTRGSSAQLATEMRQTGQAAATTGDGFEQAGRKVTASAGAQRAGMQQLSFQLGDIATMYSLGARPMQIFASQSGQVIQAVQLMAGGTSKLAAFLGGPWGVALTAATIVMVPLIGKLFEAKDALQGVEFASDALSDAQTILGRVLDDTTGRINAQSEAFLALARAQASYGLVSAMQRQATARSELDSISRGGLGDVRFEPHMGGISVRRADNGQRIVELFRSGKMTGSEAEQQLRAQMRGGVISEEAYFRSAQAITSYDVEGENVKLFDDTLSALDGDSAAGRRILGPGNDRKSSSSRDRDRSGPTQEEIAARYDRELIAVTQRILSARIQIATSAEERAELQARQVEWDRRTQLADIAADKELSKVQKDELSAATTRLADAELDAIEFRKRAEIERDAQSLADEKYSGEREALGLQLELAGTEEERKALALKLLEAEEAYLRSRLLGVIFSETATDAERERAELALKNLRETAGDRRKAVAQANETTVERYLRDLNKSPAQINEALDKISIEGLDQLEDSLVNVIRGVESLGDLFSKVADQIIADLLRIAIQQAIIKPLAESLFGGKDSGGGGFLSSLFGGGGGKEASAFAKIGSFFAGKFAQGGLIPNGQFGLVGEEGPELAFASSAGLNIVPAGETQQFLGGAAGAFNISIPISLSAPGADPAALERLRIEMERVKRDLPEMIVTTVQDASDRRILRSGGS